MSRDGRAFPRAGRVVIALTLVASLGACAVERPREADRVTGSPYPASGSTSRPTRSPGSPEPSPGVEPRGTGGGGRTNALVTGVIDGDTIEVRFRGRAITVRLIGIDTPESVAPGQPVECYALAASRFTARRLEGERVRLGFDVERLDRYGRTLAYVWLGDELFNETLVREGYAFVTTYPPNVRYVDRFLAAQREARAHERGVWGACVERDEERSCDPAYPGVCIRPPPPDLDCADVPYRRFRAEPPDPHRFDGDHDGIGCET